jgi:hypothetical protein
MRIAVATLVLTTACTTLGPMPSATLIAPVPAGRPEGEVQLALAPGYYLSSGAMDNPKGTVIPQLEALFEPDQLIVPGLILAARAVGTSDSGTILEPMLGYRRGFGDGFAASIVAYGTHSSATNKHAKYSATRLGAEIGGDGRVTADSRWVELHLTGALSLTGLTGDGALCLDKDGRFGVDCGEPPVNLTSVTGGGVYPTLTGGVALELLRHRDSAFHGGRLAFTGVVGTMPTFVGGAQTDAVLYVSLGLSLSLAVGAAN